ncbi:MAG: hypothetical protein H0V11_06975 [Actinobacteria bacterium]|nr:hypothetical protein [Actinomycetota bacterium]
MTKRTIARALLAASLAVAALAAQPASAASGGLGPLRPKVDKAVAFDVSAPLRSMHRFKSSVEEGAAARPEFGAGPVANREHSRDGAVQNGVAAPTAIPGPLFTFEGPSNEDNFALFGFRVNPPDPVGDVGRSHYVAMVNLVYSIYTKTGTLLLGPVDTGTLWANFPVDECTEPSGDPIVVYDERADRWILTQFSTRGLPPDPPNPFYNCVAVSVTGDPTGAYYRYAFTTDDRFPDYPKYGVWPDGSGGHGGGGNHGSVTITTREFAEQGNGAESIGIYALNRSQLMAGDPNTQVIEFQLTGPPNLVGDGLLPADFDGKQPPRGNSPQLIVGSQDDGARDGATFDALNVFQLDPDFQHPERSTFLLKSQLATAPFDSIYPCAPTSRDCLPQPGIVNPAQYLDILSYRQRPTWRLQYRNFGSYEALVTNQSVEARPSVAGVRWYELRNPREPFIYQQGTYAPTDGVHRWMGSVATDVQGNMAAGYSVVNATDVKPGIRYAGRLVGDPLGTLPQGEAVLINGTGVQTTLNSRWGDYTSMNVDPVDGCTFYYMNEYYLVDGTPADTRPWKTRIGAFKFPGCR